MAVSSRRSLLVVLLIFYGLLASTYSVIVPLFEGPDEDDHFRYARTIAQTLALPVQRFEPGGGEAGHQAWQPPLYYALAAVIIAPIDTSDFPQHLWRNPAATFVGDAACCGRNVYYHLNNENLPYTQTTLAVHLARLLTILFGLLAVWAIFQLAGEFFSEPLLAAATAAIVAFNPSFLFASSLISNDVPLVALCSLVLLNWVRLLRGQAPLNARSAAKLGLFLGLGILTKTSALGLLPLSLLVILIASWQQRKIAFAVTGSATMFGVISLVAGWWLVRNQILYGDPIALSLMAISATFPRAGPLTIAELFQISLPWIWQTFWGGPTPGDFPPIFLWALAFVTVVAGIGAGLRLVRMADVRTRNAFLVLVGWLVLIVTAQIQFIRTTVGGDQGRYLFPAIGAFALLLVLGLEEIAERAHRTRAPVLGAAVTLALLALALYVPFGITSPAYARPPLLSNSDLERIAHPLDVTFGNRMELLGYTVDRRSVKPGESLEVALYWRASAPMNDSYRVFVHLVGQADRSAGGADVIPGKGAFPTLYWKAGDTLRDLVRIQVAPDAVPGKYAVEVGLYPVGRPGDRVMLEDGIEDRVLLENVKVTSQQPIVYTPQTPTDLRLGTFGKLIGYDVAVESQSLLVALYWQSVNPSTLDYKVFVHVLDSNGNIIAQADREPQAGENPTSLWEPGETIRDEYVLQLPPSAIKYSIAMGMFRPDTEERVPIADSIGQTMDHFTLERDR